MSANDAKLVTILYFVKLYRFCILWLIMYLVEKIFQSRHIMRVYVEDKEPRTLIPYVVTCMLFEGVAFLIILAVLAVMMSRYKTPHNTFVVDSMLLVSVIVDYMLTTLLILAVGIIVASIVQSKTLFRYVHDGLRGIRANAAILFWISLIVLALPMFLIT